MRQICEADLVQWESCLCLAVLASPNTSQPQGGRTLVIELANEQYSDYARRLVF